MRSRLDGGVQIDGSDPFAVNQKTMRFGAVAAEGGEHEAPMPAMDLSRVEDERMLAEHRLERLASRRAELVGAALKEDLLRVCRGSDHQCRVDTREPQPERGAEPAPLAFKKAFRIAAELHGVAQAMGGNLEPAGPRAHSRSVPRP